MKADLCMFNKTAAYAYGQRFLHLWQADGANTLEHGIYNMLQLCLILYPVQIYAELLPTDSSGNIIRAQHIYISCLNAKLAAATFSVKVS